ncbi:MFS transporter [Altererythrobacter soli]|uniref:MFS transporter n=1 Tax=Croceibacterium soli TaxID=1739690 RepID=A0A6I4UVS1_9SPHN|nr:MFS transporter [Croceibacterium soli]MXP41125.1 MFS transporter [Croceibacterium soli]
MFAPLAHGVFAAIWVASILSATGSQLQQVGAAWLMTSLAPSASMVALVTAVSTLPILLFSLVSGALADVIDRRLVLIGSQFLMFGASATLAIADYAGVVTPLLLLLLTFLVGSGAAIMAPAWQSTVGELVPRDEVPQAVALNVMAFNIARTVGPAVGGVMVAVVGAGLNFTVNALSYLAMIGVLMAWQPLQQARPLPAEAVLPAMRDGIFYAFHATVVRRVLIRAMCFGFCSSIVVSLMALVARDLLGEGAAVFGVLMGCMGIGAVTGAALLGILRRRYTVERLLRIAILATACALVAIGLSRSFALTGAALFLVGSGMVLGLSTFNVSVQMAVPRWVSGRALALYQMFTFGGMTAGAWFWGNMGEVAGIGGAYLLSAATLLLTLLLAWVLPVREVGASEIAPAPDELGDPLPDAPLGVGVVVAIEYRVPASRRDAFLAAISKRQRMRLRDGARQVTLMQDAVDEELWTERFCVRCWTEHRRQLSRRTLDAKELDEALLSCHSGMDPPQHRYFFERSVRSGRRLASLRPRG